MTILADMGLPLTHELRERFLRLRV
jgi:predicted 3-demethylubiquinone-9 3-methyltransferase (glyoxalase superfamily)